MLISYAVCYFPDMESCAPLKSTVRNIMKDGVTRGIRSTSLVSATSVGLASAWLSSCTECRLLGTQTPPMLHCLCPIG